MIITISGANFSASNIGTLSTWTVSKSIGSGAEHSIPSYVDKNSAFNYTITLKDGYTFGTYSVTMGGQTITPTVTETSMTIDIASVTGAIRIEVKTINSSTGEEEGGDTGGEYTISIYPTPSIATVSVSGKTVTDNQVTADMGESITYTVSMNGFDTITDTIVVSGDETIKPWLNVTNLDVTNPIWMPNCYYNSTNTTSHPNRKLPTDLCTQNTGSGSNYVQYQSIPILTKEQLPIGSTIWIATDWTFRPDAWKNQDTFNSTRPSSVTGSGESGTTINVDETFWGKYTLCGLYVSKGTTNITDYTPEQLNEIFKITLPS